MQSGREEWIYSELLSKWFFFFFFRMSEKTTRCILFFTSAIVVWMVSALFQKKCYLLAPIIVLENKPLLHIVCIFVYAIGKTTCREVSHDKSFTSITLTFECWSSSYLWQLTIVGEKRYKDSTKPTRQTHWNVLSDCRSSFGDVSLVADIILSRTKHLGAAPRTCKGWVWWPNTACFASCSACPSPSACTSGAWRTAKLWTNTCWAVNEWPSFPLSCRWSPGTTKRSSARAPPTGLLGGGPARFIKWGSAVSGFYFYFFSTHTIYKYGSAISTFGVLRENKGVIDNEEV